MYRQPSDDIDALILRDLEAVHDDAVEEILNQRLRSGAPTEMDDGDFDAIRTRLESEIVRSRGA